MKILGALILCLCLPSLALAQRAGTTSSGGAMYSGGGGGGGSAGGVSASLTHIPATRFKYPSGKNTNGYVPSGFVPYLQAVSTAKTVPEVGTFLPFEQAVEAGREANQPTPSLGDFARAERERRKAHQPYTN